MRRRQYLAALATGLSVGVAGCNSDTTDETQTQTTAASTTTVRPLPAVELEPAGIDDNNTAGVPDRQAEAIITNPAEDPLANVSVRARWYNEDGHLLGDDVVTLPVLPAEEAWSPWIYPNSVVTEDIADVELSTSVGGYWSGSNPDVVIEESTREVLDGDVQEAYRVRGLASNETGGMAGLTVFALLRGSDGRVLYANSASQELVPAGDTWKFVMGWQSPVRWSLVDQITLYTQAT